jgi:hypothetical protein
MLDQAAKTATAVPMRVEEPSSFLPAFTAVTKSSVDRANGLKRLEKGGRMEEKLRTAIIDELRRQAEIDRELDVQQDGDRLIINGSIDLDALTMVIADSVAGGP